MKVDEVIRIIREFSQESHYYLKPDCAEELIRRIKTADCQLTLDLKGR